MTLYHVTWAERAGKILSLRSIDVEAPDPREAAAEANRQRPETDKSMAIMGFEVFECTGYERAPYRRVAIVDLRDTHAVFCLSCEENCGCIDDIEERTHQQWRCPSCGSWNDRIDI